MMSQVSAAQMKPMLSIVVGSQNAERSITECLIALESQRNGDRVEIIVVDNSTDRTAEIVSNKFPHIKLVRSAQNKLMPELWETGIQQCSGDYVAITTAHFVPASNWIKEILKAQQSSYPGIGGAIENNRASGLVAWAIYFCRYSSYMLPFGERTVEDFAGDNASYKRWALDRCRDARRDGFWESFVHSEMRRQGLELLMTPSIVVYHQKSFTCVGFMQQRFWHGRQYGSKRVSDLPPLRRLLYAGLAPGIPVISLLRITRRVAGRRRNLGHYVVSLPALMLFILSWSVGEFSGYVWPSDNAE